MLRRVREQGDVASALERDGQLALMAGARAGLAARLDLGALLWAEALPLDANGKHVLPEGAFA